MSVTTDVVAKWPTLLIALPWVIAGLAMTLRPAVFAQWQSDFWRKRYGIVAGPIGSGTKLFYRLQGIFVATVGLLVVGNSVLG
ncbi:MULTISPECIES: hypothetical protein [Novosphingobium]|uniref:Uncharacterized protein n=1 Tax=Novosphingobium subterraneum TaxID=48936 RepID=A0A0B9A8N0_9SPHN|nr:MULTISPECIES: hypothetical protein [Novosphingobium]KHS46981.1 hypothetical protein NJ75_01817 [Novosphingobium subterraneum]